MTLAKESIYVWSDLLSTLRYVRIRDRDVANYKHPSRAAALLCNRSHGLNPS